MIFGINTTRVISKFSQVSFTRLTAREITYNNFEISLVVFMPNITTNHAITYIVMVKNLDIMKPPYSEHVNSALALHYMEVPLQMKKTEFFFSFFFSFISVVKHGFRGYRNITGIIVVFLLF